MKDAVLDKIKKKYDDLYFFVKAHLVQCVLAYTCSLRAMMADECGLDPLFAKNKECHFLQELIEIFSIYLAKPNEIVGNFPAGILGKLAASNIPFDGATNSANFLPLDFAILVSESVALIRMFYPSI